MTMCLFMLNRKLIVSGSLTFFFRIAKSGVSTAAAPSLILPVSTLLHWTHSQAITSAFKYYLSAAHQLYTVVTCEWRQKVLKRSWISILPLAPSSIEQSYKILFINWSLQFHCYMLRIVMMMIMILLLQYLMTSLLRTTDAVVNIYTCSCNIHQPSETNISLVDHQSQIT